MTSLDRRALLAGGLALATAPLIIPGLALAGPPAAGRLRFDVFRNGKPIGEHVMIFAANGDTVSVTADCDLTVKLGPVPVFRYRHHAQEAWKGGRIQTLSTRTDSNGKIETVEASRTASGVAVQYAKGRYTAPAAAAPLTHWNSAILDGPLFNPQTGKLLKVSAAQKGREQVALASGAKVGATRWSLTGETTIDDWYDASGTWVALRGLLEDKSTMEYRRVAG